MCRETSSRLMAIAIFSCQIGIDGFIVGICRVWNADRPNAALKTQSRRLLFRLCPQVLPNTVAAFERRSSHFRRGNADAPGILLECLEGPVTQFNRQCLAHRLCYSACSSSSSGGT